MHIYIRHLQNILDHGIRKTDRTGTGTITLKGQSMEFDLAEGFPLVTTKKSGIQDIYKENKWIGGGDTSNRALNKMGCNIWNEWADAEGRLGPIYGAMWRRKPSAKIEYLWLPREAAKTKRLFSVEFFAFEVNKLGGGQPTGMSLLSRLLDGQSEQAKELLKKYKTAAMAYSQVIVEFISHNVKIDKALIDERWLDFENFLEDFSKMAGNELVNTSPTGDVRNEVIIYTRANYGIESKGCTVFDRHSVQFIPKEFSTYVEKARRLTITDGRFGDDIRWLVPIFYIDQLAEVEKALASRSDSRRIIIDGWEPSLTPLSGVEPDQQASFGRQALPTCHTLYQFFVDPIEGTDNHKLSLVMYQRSQDAVLGAPYNIASCALFVHLLAKKYDLVPGKLTIDGGDCHIYLNHLATLKKQMAEPILKSPTLEIIGDDIDFDDLSNIQVALHNYNHGPVYRYPVAV